MDAIGLPKELTFASFRHGGITEFADADLTDRQMRALSGHRTADVLDIYAKRTRTQRATAARKRWQGWIAGSGPKTSPLSSARTEIGFAFPDLIKALEIGDGARGQKIDIALNAANVWVDRLKAEPTL